MLEHELLFTETYKRYKGEHKAKREIECLKVQLNSLLCPVKSGDLIAGRKQYNPIGFYHIMYGDGVSDGIDKTGFCFDEKKLRKKMDTASLNPELKLKIEEMIQYWKQENSNYKARQRFDEDMAFAAPSDHWEADNAIVHPLYRIAEIQPEYKKLIELGIPGLRKEIINHLRRVEKYGGDKIFYSSMLEAVELLVTTIDFYIEDIDRKLVTEPEWETELTEMKDVLMQIRENRPSTFREALQLAWIYAIVAGVADFHRMDVVFGDLFVHDIQTGRMTREQGIHLLHNTWGLIQDTFARNSRVIVGGVGRLNEENADEFALAAMEATLRHKEPFPQLSLRWYEGMNEALFDCALEVLGEGVTFPVLYNDDVNIESVEKAFEVTREVAEDYSFFGCGEQILGHRSIGTPNAIINMAKVMEMTLYNGVDPLTGEKMGLETGEFSSFQSFDEFFTAYDKQMEFFVHQSAKIQDTIYKALDQDASFLLESMLVRDCLQRGKGMLGGGIQHLGGTYETYGNVTTSDSLYAIKTAVFEKQLVQPETLLEALKKDFAGFEKERELLLNIPKYGNDIEDVDAMAAKVHEHICLVSKAQKEVTDLDSFLVVMINNSANSVLGKYTGATPDGRNSKDVLSNANGPTQGMDTKGLTALINSLAKMETGIHAGVTQNFKFSKKLFQEHREIVKQHLLVYFEKGGTMANVSVVSKEDLIRALEEPEKYRNLLVRIGGYSIRFVDLDREAQEDMIRRTIY